jgi:hypothetical protein
MLTLATLFGAIVGTAVLNGLALLITKAWPMSVQKILVVSIVMFFLLALGIMPFASMSQCRLRFCVSASLRLSLLFCC